MKLEDLGWDPEYQRNFDELGAEGLTIGRVSRVDAGGRCLVLTARGDLNARIPGRMMDQADSACDLPCTGDWVAVKETETANIIVSVLERRNLFVRQSKGEDTGPQPIGANIDTVLIVMGLDHDYSIRRLERYIFIVRSAGADPVIVLNKVDLVDDLDTFLTEVEAAAGDVPVHALGAREGIGLDLVRQYISKGSTVSLVGSSGAGKSTLINAFLGKDAIRTGEVREKDGKGRHVTTNREIYILPEGGVLIDNPGMREIQLWGEAASLEETFSEIVALSGGCRFKDCRHMSEPGCAIKAALEDGSIPEDRYNSYLKMLRELEYLQQKQAMGAKRTEKAKWRGILKDADRYKSFKRGE